MADSVLKKFHDGSAEMHKSSGTMPHIFSRKESRRQTARSSSPSEQEQPVGLGEKLRRARIEKGLELADIQQQTKISLHNLTAMEEGRYDGLPAYSFCRGFYKMYASTIGLDPEDAAYQFEQEYTSQPQHKDLPAFTFGTQNREVEVMAGRPSLLSLSSLGVILLILLFFGAFLCWFFSWNPASFLSQQLRNLTPPPHYQTLRQTTDTFSIGQLLPKERAAHTFSPVLLRKTEIFPG